MVGTRGLRVLRGMAVVAVAVALGAGVTRGDDGARSPLSKDDVLMLVELGVAEDEIVKQVDARGASIDAAELPALRAKVGPRVHEALERRCKVASMPLKKGELLRLLDLHVADDEVARLVARRGAALSPEDVEEIKARLPEGSKVLELILPKKKKAPPFGRDEVLALSKEGVPPAEIVARIEASDSRFELTTDDLLALKKEGVDATVLRAMMARKPAPSAPAEAGRYVHPTYAFGIDRLPGFKVEQHYDGGEMLRVSFTGEDGDELRFDVLPIRDRIDWDDESLLLLHQQYVSEEFGAKATSVIVHRIGNVTLKGFEGDASVAGAPVKYRTYVGLTDEAILYLSLSTKPERWERVLPVFQRALASLVVPAIPELRAPHGAPELPSNASNRAVATVLKHSVVHVKIQDQRAVGDRTQVIGFGTGFIVHEDGYVLTNRHVVQEGQAGDANRRLFETFELTWDLDTKRNPVIADLVGVSERYDVACLKIRAPGPYQPVPLADVTRAASGDHGLVLGFPRPQELGSLQMNTNDGTISAVEKDEQGRVLWIRHVIQTDQGNSGGPLLDTELGGVVGLHTQSVLVTRSNDARETAHATAWRAVPIHQAIREFPQIVAGGREGDLSAEDRVQRLAFYYGQKRWGSVAVEARRILQGSRHDKFALAYLAHVFQKQGDRARALDSLEQLLREHDEDGFALEHAVSIYLDLGQVEEATRWSERLAANPIAKKDVTAQILIAICKLRTGKLAESLERLHEADKLAHGRNASVALLQATATWQKAIADKQVYTASGRRYVDTGVKERVERFCSRSLELKPRGNPEAWSLLAEVARFENDGKKALEYCEKGFATAPQSASIRLKAARILIDDVRAPERAIPLVQQALEIDETARGWALLGEAYLVLVGSAKTSKDAALLHERCHGALSRAIELDPRSLCAAECLFLLGALHERFGSKDEAVNCYRRCLELRPDHVDVNESMFKTAEDRVSAIRGPKPQGGAARPR